MKPNKDAQTLTKLNEEQLLIDMVRDIHSHPKTQKLTTFDGAVMYEWEVDFLRGNKIINSKGITDIVRYARYKEAKRKIIDDDRKRSYARKVNTPPVSAYNQ